MKASVLLVVKNEDAYIKKCVDSLLKQTFQDIEIIVLDNGSTDGTKSKIMSFDDPRITYLHEASVPGIAGLRNICVRAAKGDYLFFTDGDCVPGRHWIEEGAKALMDQDVLGVEGATYYQSSKKISIRDSNVYQYDPGEFMTCNIAYRRDAVLKAGLFDKAFRIGHEDRDLALRIMKSGKIAFCPEMLVAHQKKTLNIKGLFHRAKRVKDMVHLIKIHSLNEQHKHGQQDRWSSRVLYPRKLIFILFPPLLILTERYVSIKDIVFGICKYFSYIYERLLIWRSAIKERIFLF